MLGCLIPDIFTADEFCLVLELSFKAEELFENSVTLSDDLVSRSEILRADFTSSAVLEILFFSDLFSLDWSL